MSAIEIKNLSKKFNNFSAVKNLTFEVGENRVFGFLGPNGAGKTTTIRMMAGLIKPTAGEIKINNQIIDFESSDSKNGFGYLPEQPSFYAWMTGLEYLNFVSDIFQIDDKANKIKKMLKLVDLTEAKDRRISNYSNGMKQRLGIAQSLIHDPKVIIMDEPVSALDPIGRKEVLEIITELKKDRTVFMSTHILADVDRICDDVAIINKGELVKVASLADLKETFSKPILEVEFKADPKSVIKSLEKETWTGKIEHDGNQLRIWLQDDSVIEKNIPLKFFANEEIGVLRYGLNLPEIEDLFIELVEGKK